ncbi:hypothetical protein [Nonomuraea fuscirosea]|uniref:hypothetical protein n=1 Tax=Nonomuraea fuscirosea TaxID=1291556 RepID=UPI00343B21F2
MVARASKIIASLGAGLLLNAAVPAAALASGWQASYQDGTVATRRSVPHQGL